MTQVQIFVRKIKKWLNKPHRVFAAFMVLVMSGYGVSQALPANAAACATSGHFVILENCDLAVGSHTFTGTLTITGTVTAGDDTTPGLVTITAGNIIISSTGTLTTAGLGSDLGIGTGQGADAADGGGGGGYGGKGGQSGYSDAGGSTHGTIAAPTALGSGGGNDGGTTGQGGGAVKLITTGTLTNNGTITSNGEAAITNQTGGGSGGSIWIDAGTLSGSGSVTANGGRGAPAASGSTGGGGGGGGRIAIFFDTDSSTWTNTTFGGDEGGTTSTATCGGSGTVYEKDNAITDGDLTVDNNDQTNCGTTDTSEGGIFSIANLYLKNAAYFVIASGDTYNVITAFTGSGAITPTLMVADGGTQDLPGTSLTFAGLDWVMDGSVSTLTDLTISGGTVYSSAGTFDAGCTSLTVGDGGTFLQNDTGTFSCTTITIQSGGKMAHADNSTAQTYKLDISATTIDIQSGGTVDVDGLGYNMSNGPGTAATVNSEPGGGAYGGDGGDGNFGANAGGSPYGNVREPSQLGSGGGKYNFSAVSGGSGGGAVKLVASSTITVAGTITANGENAGSFHAGGSGGAVWLSGASIQGTGTITANGGSSIGSAGGGGAGRVSINYTGSASSTFVDGSAVTAKGGTDSNNGYTGGAGTIYVSDGTGSGDLIVNNANRTGTNASSTTTQVGNTDSFDNITIASGAKYIIPNTKSLTISATGTLTGGGTNQASLQVVSGATFDTSATSFTFDDLDVNHDGTIASVTTLSLADTDFDHDGDFSATVTQFNFNPATATTFRHNGTGFNDLTLSLDDNGTFISETTSYDNLTSLTLGSTGTFSQSHTNVLDITTVTIESGGTLTHADNSTAQSYVLDINVTNIDIQSGGQIDVDGRGYDLSSGPGTALTVNSEPGGGAYGGDGGYGNGGINLGGDGYGNVREPVSLGSGGGKYNFSAINGGSGGGLVKIVASGTITVAGTITADGANGASFHAGGSGGAVWISAPTIAGAGAITSDGGNSIGKAGGGGGGRVSINYTSSATSGFADGSAVITQGGTDASTGHSGGAGTVYVSDGSGSGDLVVSNANQTGTGSSSTTTLINTADMFDNVTISSGAKYVIPSGGTFTLSATGTFTTGGTNQASLQIVSGGTLDPNVTSFTFDDIDVNNDGTIATVTTLSLADTDFDHDGNFSAGVSQLNFNSATATTFRQNGSGLSESTLAIGNNATFIIEDATYDNLTSITVQNTGTLEISHASTLDVTTLTIESGGLIVHTDNSTTQAYVIDINATTIDIQSGGDINVDNLGFDKSYGDGAGPTSNGSSGGGGYGGVGGAGTTGAGGTTHGSATAPNVLGSGGGKYNFSSSGVGSGGGAVKLVASGTLTVNGDITADGQTSTNFHGGGSGGSVWLDAGTLAGNCALVTVHGGAGITNSGGGGGGRAFLTYTSKTCTGTPTATGGSASGGGTAGSVGTVTLQLKSPTINSVGHTPSSPTVTDSVTLTSSVTYASGIDRIEVYLDGTSAGNLKKTCDMASATSGNCNVDVGQLSGGSHTTTVKAFGDDATEASDTDTFAVIVGTTNNVGTVGRSKINSATTFALSFTLTNTYSSDLTITFPASFTLTGAFTAGTCGSGTIHTFAFDNDAHTLTASKTDCTGAVNLSGANITLPGTTGLYTVSWTNEDPGEVVIPVTDDDQVTVSANVTGEITFDLDIGTSNVNNAAPYTLAFGELDTASANGSNDSTVSGIWIDLSTNATAGAVVQVKSVNAALKSASVPGDTIASSSGSVNAGGIERYGLCIATAGNGTVTASAGTLQSVAPFTGSGLGCTTTNSTVGALTTSFQTFLNSNSLPIDGGRTQVRLKVDISDTTPAHDDYADTLTFRATATF